MMSKEVAHDECGFSMIEFIVALGIFGVVLMSTSSAFMSLVRHNNNMEVRSEAMQVAQQVLDQKRQLNPSAMPASGSDPVETVSIGESDYQVIVSYCSDASHCTDPTVRMLRVEVFSNNQKVFDVDTVYTKLR